MRVDEPRAPKGSGEGTAAATATLAATATATATCATSAAPALAAAPAAARGEGRGEGHPMPHQRHWLGRNSPGKNNTVSQIIIIIIIIKSFFTGTRASSRRLAPSSSRSGRGRTRFQSEHRQIDFPQLMLSISNYFATQNPFPRVFAWQDPGEGPQQGLAEGREPGEGGELRKGGSLRCKGLIQFPTNKFIYKKILISFPDRQRTQQAWPEEGRRRVHVKYI